MACVDPQGVLILAIHGSPGDPERARREFSFLAAPGRPLEVLTLSGDESVDSRLAGIAARHPCAAFTVAPLLLAAGYHLQHDLLPAVQALQDAGREVRLLPLWGRSEPFARALARSLRAMVKGRIPAGGLLWLVPGGSAALAGLRRGVDDTRVLPHELRQHWATRISDDLPRDTLPLIAVLREGRLSATLRKAWGGARRPRLLFSQAALRSALLRWTEPAAALAAAPQLGGA